MTKLEILGPPEIALKLMAFQCDYIHAVETFGGLAHRFAIS